MTSIVDLPHVVYVHITIDTIKIPLQAARRNDDTFLLKFRPIIEGDYLIILKNYMGQPMLGKMRKKYYISAEDEFYVSSFSVKTEVSEVCSAHL